MPLSWSSLRLGLHAPPLRTAVIVPLAYFTVAALTLSAFGTDSAIWFSNAIILTALLRHDPGTWSALASLTAIADALAAVLFGGTPVIVASALAACDAFEVLLAAGILYKLGGVAPRLTSARWVGLFALVALLVPTLSATGGALVLALSEGVPFFIAWKVWYVGAALGLLTVTPFLLSWTDRTLRRDTSPRLIVEMLLLAALVFAVAFYVFTENRVSLAFLTFPALLLATFRAGLPGATFAAVVLAIAAGWLTITGHGPFAAVAGLDEGQRIQLVQVYLAAVLLSTLPVATVLAERATLIAQLRQTGAAAESAGRAKTDFLAAMSHEIRTPLTGVLGMADLLAAEELDDRQRTYVRAIRGSGRHLLDVINDVLDFSRVEAGALELEQIDFTFGQVLEPVRSMMTPQALERGLELRFEVDAQASSVLRGDPTRLRQVLLNLVGNGIKFTHHGEVIVAVRHRHATEKHERLRVEVRDTGIGISAAEKAQLFQPFTQADRSTTRRYGGSGLGLMLSKRLVDAMGGIIGVESAPGFGSLFWFEIEFERGDVVSFERSSLALAVTAPLRVLVAEDVALNRDLLYEVLSRRGHEVVFAANGKEAVEVASQAGFDVVLMDVQMPLMDGVEAARRIRKLSSPAGQVPIVALTASVLANERERYHAAGMDRVLAKPIDWPEMFRVLAELTNPSLKPGNAEARDAVPDSVSPLLDMNVLNELRIGVGREVLKRLLTSALAEIEATCIRIDACLDQPSEVRRLAHGLRGMSGNMGLARIGELAGTIEEGAEIGLELKELLGHLRMMVTATRDEVRLLEG